MVSCSPGLHVWLSHPSRIPVWVTRGSACRLVTLTSHPCSQEEQVRTHEAKLKAMASELREHRAAHLGKKARGKEADEQRQREAYLEFEVSIQAWGLGISQRTRLGIRV